MPKSWDLSNLPARYQEQARAQLSDKTSAPEPPKRTRGRPEGELQDQIVERLQAFGYLVAYFRPAKVMRGGVEKYETPVGGDGAGWPDVVAVHPATGKALVLELKSEDGRVAEAQLEWLRAWQGVQGATVMVVRPSSWRDLEQLL